MPRPYSFLSIWSVSLVALLAAPAHATIFAEAIVRQLSPNTNICGEGGVGTSSADADCSGDLYDGEAHATAAYGELGTYARLSYTGDLPFPNDDFQAYGWARWSDRISLSSDLLLPGATTDARLIIGVDGSGYRIAPDFFDGGSLFVDTTLRVVINGLEATPNTGEIVGAPFGTYAYDFNMLNGGDALVSVELISDVRCFSCGGPYDGLSDWLNTAILDEVQIQGLTSEEFTLSSEAGATYGNVIPEPSVGLMIVTALLAGLGARQRRV
jgi:hypothetical protein